MILRSNGVSSHISWHVELALKDGTLDDFAVLTREMTESARREPGVLIYERFVSPDGKQVYIYERYTDSRAALAHLRTFDKRFGARFQKLAARQRFIVMGTPTSSLRDKLDRYGAIYARHISGLN